MYLKNTAMIVLFTVLLAFFLNLIFLVLECRNRVWQERKFWVLLTVLVLVVATAIVGNQS